jgi:hypothetical protein
MVEHRKPHQKEDDFEDYESLSSTKEGSHYAQQQQSFASKRDPLAELIVSTY